MPSEYPPALRSAASVRPTWSNTSATLASGNPAAAASTRRWFRPVRSGWKLWTSSTAPTARVGWARLAYGRPSTVAVPDVGFTKARSIRNVVLFPAPFGPRNPVTRPGRTSKLRSSTAVTARKRFVSPLATMAGDPGASCRRSAGPGPASMVLIIVLSFTWTSRRVPR